MSVIQEPDGWMRFGEGRRWRCCGPRYVCEVDRPDAVPSYLGTPSAVARIRRARAFYAGRVRLGVLDAEGTGLDLLVANSMAESLGTVPSPLSSRSLRETYERAIGGPGERLGAVVLRVHDEAKYLERREPGYVDPVTTPGRVSVSAHHVLVSTALGLRGVSARDTAVRTEAIADVVCRIPAESIEAAALAIAYLVRSYGQHLNQPPLVAATHNAGSPRPDASNPWNLRQYGAHVDRWVAYYNTCRLV